MAKTVVVDFTDQTQKPYTNVPDAILSDKDKAGREIVSRAKKDYPKKEVQTWSIEDGDRFVAPTLDEEINAAVDFPEAFILSKSANGKRIVKLGDLLKGKGLVGQKGLTNKEIVQNLRNLAVNALDPIKAKYPNMKITSAFRIAGKLKESVANSDHDLGAAADLQFSKVESSAYIDIAIWISKNVPHKQLLLEFKALDDGSLTTWIHIAFLQANGTLLKSAMPVGTMFNQATYAPGKFVNVA